MKVLSRLSCALLLLAGRTAAAEPMPPPLADLAAKLLPSVVSVASVDPVTNNSDSDDGNDNDNNDGNGDNGGDDQGSFHPSRAADTTSGSVLAPPKAEEALGSGFVFDPAGYILTNNHVIQGATSVTVTFQDGTILPATVVGRDKDGDLAVLKVSAGRPLPAVNFGDSGRLRVGDWVLAIGNPFGLPGSTSAGIVSALDRDIGENKYDDFIQTDAAVNRGNSGGPLFNLAGQVIGVNSAIYSPDGGSVGIGFAIPSAMAAPVAQSLKTSGGISRGWLGVSTQEVTPQIQHLLGLPDSAGALVGGTSPHGPADGVLQPGDVLTALAGAPIKNPRTLMIRTAEIPTGQKAPVGYWRGGALHQATLTIRPPPAQLDDTETAAPAAAPSNVAVAAIGLTLTSADGGLQVISVKPGGPSAKAGIVADNLIEQINGMPVAAPLGLSAQLKQLAVDQAPAVLLISGDTADGADPGPRWVAVRPK